MNPPYLSEQELLCSDFQTITSTQEIVSGTDLDAFYGVLIHADPTDTFETFSIEDDKIQEKGDIIVKVNNRQVNTNEQLQNVLEDYKENTKINLTIVKPDKSIEEIVIKFTDTGFTTVEDKTEPQVDFSPGSTSEESMKIAVFRYILIGLILIIVIGLTVFVLNVAITALLDMPEFTDVLELLNE